MGIALVVLSSILAGAERTRAGIVCQPSETQIGMTLSQYSPRFATIEPGDTVCFVNSSTVSHTVTPTVTDSFDGVTLAEGGLQPGDGFHVTFPDAGSYAFFCEVHGSGMNGAITVSVPDTTPPGPPTDLTTDPSSPANDNDPEVKGNAEAGSQVQLYTDATCDTPVGSSKGAAGFAGTGITVHVADNTETTFYATATDAATNESDCSAGVTYIEESPPDSTPPALVVLTSKPKKETTRRKATFTWTEEPDTEYSCSLDEGAFEPCQGAGATYTDLTRGRHEFAVYGTDQADNLGPTKTYRWRIVRR